MRRLAPIVLLLLGLGPAQAGSDVVIRTALDPASGAVVGQPINLLVDVLFPERMVHPPRVRIADVPGAQVLRFETQGVTIRDAVGGQAYVGQEFTFVVFPRRGGPLEIPAPEVTLVDGSGDPVGSVLGPPQHTVVDVPPGIDASGPVMAAEQVTATERWDPDPAISHLKPGAAITRTIRRRAEGVSALGMADLSFAAPGGVRVYADPPQADDNVSRGRVEGSRTDRLTYVFEKPGSYTLPGVTQPWWDLAAKESRLASVAGIRVVIEPEIARANARRIRGEEGRGIAIAGAAVMLAAILAALFPRLHAMWSAWRRRAAASEAATRRTLRRIAPTGDAAATYRALSTWLGRLPVAERQLVVEALRMRPLVDELERSLFGDGIWSGALGAELADAVSGLAPRSNARHAERSALPPLNPARHL